MKTLMENVSLVAHIKLDPNDFRTRKKTELSKIPRKDRLYYWRESFAQVGVDDLLPVHDWLVSVGDIHQEVILHHLTKTRRLPRVHDSRTTQADKLPHAQRDSGIEHLESGLSLLHEGRIIVPSMCCGDLSDIGGWQATAQCSGAWTMLWNGHPWLYVRSDGTWIIFTEPTEKEPTSSTKGRFAIPVALFQQAVAKASQDIESFLDRFEAYVQKETR